RPLAAPEFAQLRFLETKIVKQRDGAILQLLGLRRVSELRRLLGEERHLTLAEALDGLRVLGRLTFPYCYDLLLAGRDSLLPGIPLGVTDWIGNGELLYIFQRFDVGEFAGVGVLQVGKHDRNGVLVLATRLFHARALGVQRLGSFSGLLLSPGKVRVAGPLA